MITGILAAGACLRPQATDERQPNEPIQTACEKLGAVPETLWRELRQCRVECSWVIAGQREALAVEHFAVYNGLRNCYETTEARGLCSVDVIILAFYNMSKILLYTHILKYQK